MFSDNQPSQEKNSFPWIALNEITQLTEIQQAKDTTMVIFKHSTRCGISSSVLNRFEKKHQHTTAGIEFYFLDLLNFRALSAEIAARFMVIHQSPQLILIKDGTVITQASHYDILDVKL
jgi:bacillithiol system protein YtxJ